MSNLALRALTAVVGLPLVAALVLWREPRGFGALVLLVCALALTELTGMVLATGSRRLRALVVVAGCGLYLGLYLAPAWAMLWGIAAFIATATVVLLEPGDI